MARKSPSRRSFISTSGKTLIASCAVSGFPAIVSASVLGAASPGNRINIGAIGTGRISRAHDLPGHLEVQHGKNRRGVRSRQ
jgi:hypothetical protein